MTKLKDLTINITDWEHWTVIDSVNGEFFLLSNKNIIEWDIVIWDDDRKISKETFNKINKRTKIEVDDVLISTVWTIWKSAIVRQNPNYTFQRSVWIIKTNKNKLNPDYLYYYLNQNYIVQLLKKLSKWWVQKCLFIWDLEDLNINIPDINEQKRIVKILNLIDKQIQRNKDMVQKLQVLTKAISYLFRNWEIRYAA